MRMKSIALIAVLLSTSAYAQLKEGSFACIEEWSAGGKFSPSKKRWEGVIFQDKKEFVVKLTRTHIDAYTITITKTGYRTPSACAWGDYSEMAISDNNTTGCKLDSTEYRFHLETLKFITLDREGFLDGKNNHDETPYIAGGTCTKID